MKFSPADSLALWKRRLAYRQRKLAKVRADAHQSGPGKGHVSDPEAARIHKWERLVTEAQHSVALRKRQQPVPLRLKALANAERLIGIMEVGGNNMGTAVLALIRENGGVGPESWCGDFVADVYRRAGSKVVQRAWAAVRYLGFATGMTVISVRSLLPGNIVCFIFDHTGIFVRYLKQSGSRYVPCSAAEATHIETIEGNTGRTGAVSDSRTGGDGVYRKIRAIGLVARGVSVSR